MSFSSAHNLATKITLVITGVLLLLIFTAYLIGEQNFRQGSKNIFLERVDRISSSLNNGNTQSRRGPLPNSITLEGERMDIRGAEFLTDNQEIHPEFIRNLPVDLITQEEIHGEPILFYKIIRGNRMIVLFEPVGFLERAEKNTLLYGVIALCAFAFLLYVVAYRIALLTIAPIEKARIHAESYARSLAHEMKTPLAVILTDLELARIETPKSKILLSASNEVGTLKKVVDALLMLAAHEEIHMDLIDLEKLFESIWKEKQNFFSRMDLSYEWGGKENTLFVEAILVHIFFSNLVENIMKYSLPGKVHIQMSSTELVIKNPAKMLSESEISNIFDPFISYGGKGTGIGLSLVSQIAQEHHWRVSARQEDGHMIFSLLFQKVL